MEEDMFEKFILFSSSVVEWWNSQSDFFLLDAVIGGGVLIVLLGVYFLYTIPKQVHSKNLHTHMLIERIKKEGAT